MVSAGAIVLVGTAVFAVGCATGGTGLRDGGPARTDTVARTAPPGSSPADGSSASPSPSGTPLKKVDPVRLLMADPKVGADVKRDLKPCTGKEYPVDVSYGKVTGGPVADIVVNVLSCADALGRGTYVYRADGARYENVFADEQPPVYAEIDRGDLVVTKQVYGKSDALAYPSGEDVITYRWDGEKFTEQDRVHSEYSNVVDGGVQPAPATSQKN
ncbi:lipoprotein [Streptomyces sp. WM6373]|nr:lipoprotein [Streptomyces sp. WM6373]KOU60675.1 lipoprotein [Streptomyces sp. IGB124]KOU79807.1 lipoprotein [Streptomyces sp. XY66]KOU82159.1 lipoprotein [Streptomyces sp. XY58]KOV02701.1 lipoprotein [Streptomyces sp. XY37]KOV19646.1 lipoprotein [Streptomyces sp. XY413]KOV34480.1 lipoprotein [Streptomyces sp. H021]KOV42709.1 lipoprotein [Streptomyces sp. MMG1064]